MKHIITLILFALITTQILFSQMRTFFVKPIQTNESYVAAQDSHLVVFNSSVAHNNKLFIYIGGTGSTPKNTTYILRIAANLGYNVISLAYANSLSAASACASSSDSLCYYKFREEICYGTNTSNIVATDSLNSLNGRALSLINYLALTYPTQNWDQFISGNKLVWSKIAVGGHSQGGGHALYFSKTQSVDRVCMFSSINDYNDYYNRPAAWLREPFNTSFARFFSFLHVNDDVISFSKQLQNQGALGVFSLGDDSTLIDNLATPYLNSHVLYTNTAPAGNLFPGALHNSTVVDYSTPMITSINPKFSSVWTYMLSLSIGTSVNALKYSDLNFSIYPNPVNNILNIQSNFKTKDNSILKISNCLGQVLINKMVSNESDLIQINISDLQQGIYFLTLNGNTIKFVKK